MVEKHKMIADLEQLNYTSDMLRRAWDLQVETLKLLVSGGWTNNHVIELVNYIRSTDYAAQLFPGNSLGRLLISKPRNGKLNYQQTLTISVDNIKGKIVLTYSDWDIIDRPEDWQQTVLWTRECGGEELKEKFNQFLEWNKNWR